MEGLLTKASSTACDWLKGFSNKEWARPRSLVFSESFVASDRFPCVKPEVSSLMRLTD